MEKIVRQTAAHYGWGAGCDGWHLVRQADMSVIHERMPPGTSETRHFHVFSNGVSRDDRIEQ